MLIKRNRLQKLADQLEALPLQQELKQKKIQLTTTTNRINDSIVSLEKAFGRISTLREMQGQPDLLSAEISQKVKILFSALKILEQQIKPQGVASKLTTGLDSLAKASKAISDQVTETWDAVDTDMLVATQTLIELTSKYDKNAKHALQNVLFEFNNCRNPDGQDAVARYLTARENLQQARAALNIPGNVGKFLSDALRGTASINALFEPEIQSFLKEQPSILSQLTVKLS